MKKKTLEKIQLLTLDIEKKYKKPWLVTAEILKISGQDILQVNLYENLGKGEQLPKFCLFLTDKEDALLEVGNKTWKMQKIETLPHVSWGVKNYFEIINENSVKAIQTFTKNVNYYDDDPMSRIQRMQEEFRSIKTRRAWDLRVERIERQMEIIDAIPIPEDFKKFIDDSFSNQRYQFYKAERNHRYVNVSCPHCKMKLRIDTKNDKKPKHNEAGICISCGSRIMYKATGRQQEIRDIKEIILMQRTEDGFVSRYFNAYRNCGFEYENYKYHEKARVVFNGKRAKTYYNLHERYSEPYWWDSNGGYGYANITFGKGSVYYKNLDEVLKGTTFQYCALKQLAEHEKGYVVNHDSFLSHFESRRFIEYLIKMQLYNLANDYVSNYYTSTVNEKGKNMQEILNLPKQQINRLIEFDGNLYALKILQMEGKEGSSFSNEQIKFITENNLNLDNLGRVLEHTTIGKALKYIKQNGATKNVLSDWRDYIYNCNLLGYDLNNEFVLFPRHFKKAHDDTTKRVLDKKNEYQDQEYKKVRVDTVEKYLYETKSFAVVVPERTSDIIMEGQKLHHCVGTYVDRVVKKETVILFIRRTEEMEEPFYTMEVRKDEIIQVRGKNNCTTTPQVKQFVDIFRKNILEKDRIKEAV